MGIFSGGAKFHGFILEYGSCHSSRILGTQAAPLLFGEGMEWTYILIDDGDLRNGIRLAASHMKSACVPRSTNHTSGGESALWALA